MRENIGKQKKIKIILGVLLVILFIGLLFFLFAGDNFQVLKEIFSGDHTKEEIQESIGKLGVRAYIVVFILSMIQVILTFVPAEPLHVISGVSFGLWGGMAICLAGILVGNTIIYVLYKIYGAKLTDYFASNVDFDFEVARTSTKIALIVIILYCLPAIPYGIICFFAASMGMKYGKYILITGIGSIPSLFLDVGLGHITMSTSWAVSISVFVVIIILLVVVVKNKKWIFDKVNAYVKNSQEKERKRVGKYNPFLFGLAGGLVYTTVRSKVKIKFKNNVGRLCKPCIVLCNHGSFYDFVYAGKMIVKDKPHFVVARMYFHHKWLGRIISSSGAFPKSMFTTDIDSSRNCLKVIAANEVLAMMPEARLSTVGKFEGIQPVTYKFISKMNVPVYVIKINGSYLAKPKWGDKIRKGAVVEAELNKLLDEGECSSLSHAELQDRIEKALDYNEWEWLKNNPQVTYKHKTIAEGLENILCICPKCKSHYSLRTHKNIVTCEKCDLQVSLDNRYVLSGVKFENIAQWYDWQKKEFAKIIKKNQDFKLQSKVELRHLSKDGKSFTRHAGYGECSLSREGLRYIGSDDGVDVERLFPLENIYRILFGAGEDFEIYDGSEIYYFVPEDKRSCVAWYIVSELLKEKEE